MHVISGTQKVLEVKMYNVPGFANPTEEPATTRYITSLETEEDCNSVVVSYGAQHNWYSTSLNAWNAVRISRGWEPVDTMETNLNFGVPVSNAGIGIAVDFSNCAEINAQFLNSTVITKSGYNNVFYNAVNEWQEVSFLPNSGGKLVQLRLREITVTLLAPEVATATPTSTATATPSPTSTATATPLPVITEPQLEYSFSPIRYLSGSLGEIDLVITNTDTVSLTLGYPTGPEIGPGEVKTFNSFVNKRIGGYANSIIWGPLRASVMLHGKDWDKAEAQKADSSIYAGWSKMSWFSFFEVKVGGLGSLEQDPIISQVLCNIKGPNTTEKSQVSFDFKSQTCRWESGTVSLENEKFFPKRFEEFFLVLSVVGTDGEHPLKTIGGLSFSGRVFAPVIIKK